MAKYAVKPGVMRPVSGVVVDAVQLVEANNVALVDFFEKTNCPFEVTGDHEIVVHGGYGEVRIHKGEWLIFGDKDRFYVCEDEGFHQTYYLLPEQEQ